MTNEERMTLLEQRMAQLESRIANLEARNMTYGPINPTPPAMPNWPIKNPWEPPYTITCKMADGSIQEIKLDGPIVAQGAK
jgi:hypothetical protein